MHQPEADEKKIVATLVQHLEETGRTKLLPRIARELAILEARRAKLAPQVEVASEGEAHTALAEAKAAGIEVSKATVNHALIKGWRARNGGTLIDKSAKRGLIDIYRNVTN